MNKVLADPRPIRLKGRSFLALVLCPELPVDNWLARLEDLAQRSAGFFLKRPVVLDVNGLDIDRPQLKELLDELASRNVRIMGIEGARQSLLTLDMPPAMKDGRPAADFEPPADPTAADPTADGAPGTADEPVAGDRSAGKAETDAPDADAAGPERGASSIIVKTPVRSGQSVIFPEGDVTVLGSVASGAEVVAGGSIHVYGTLRGRALAGSVGNASARIFCRRLEAELLAIDGLYKTADDLEPRLRGKAVQLWLDGDAIIAETLD